MHLWEVAWLLFNGVLGFGLTLVIPAIGSLWDWFHARNWKVKVNSEASPYMASVQMHTPKRSRRSFRGKLKGECAHQPQLDTSALYSSCATSARCSR